MDEGTILKIDFLKNILRNHTFAYDRLRFRLINTPVISAFRFLAIYATYLKFSKLKTQNSKKMTCSGYDTIDTYRSFTGKFFMVEKIPPFKNSSFF